MYMYMYIYIYRVYIWFTYIYTGLDAHDVDLKNSIDLKAGFASFDFHVWALSIAGAR